MLLWLLASAVGIGYSVFRWVKRQEAPILSITRTLFCAVLAARVTWTNTATTTLFFVTLAIWIGAQLLVKHFKSKGPDRPLTETEKIERSGLSEDDLRMVKLVEQVEGRRLTIEEIREKFREVDELSAQEAAEAAEEEAREREDNEALRVMRHDEWMKVKFCISHAAVFDVEGDVEMKLAAGEYHGNWRISVMKAPDDVESRAVAFSELKFTTADGRAWLAESHVLLDQIFDVFRLHEDAREPKARWWLSGDEQVQRTLNERCIIADLTIFNDNRVRFPLDIEGQRHCIMQKYLTWVVDAALLDDGGTVIVRVKKLWAEVYDGDVFAEGEENEAEFENAETVPPFFFTLSVTEFLPLPGTNYHFRTRDAVEKWNGESLPDKPLLKQVSSVR